MSPPSISDYMLISGVRSVIISARGYVFVFLLFVCLTLSNLRKNLQTDLHEIFS